LVLFNKPKTQIQEAVQKIKEDLGLEEGDDFVVCK
jgi:hypothetical protein